MEGIQDKKKKKAWPLIFVLVFLAFLGVFVWRVAYYSKLIREGMLTESPYAFTDQMTTDAAVAAVAQRQGDVDVVTDDDPSLGQPGAVLTIVEFGDFGCPYCRQASFAVRSLMNEYQDRVRFIYRDYPMELAHPGAQAAAEAGECAQEQDKFWEFHDKVFQNQSDLSAERLTQHARELNMNVPAFESCLGSGRYSDEVLQDYQEGLQAGVTGTPTFFFNGNRIPGAIPLDIFRQIIEAFFSASPTTP